MAELPDWCEPLLDSPRMRAVDRWAIEQQGIPSLDLMERAGQGVARAVEELVPDGPVVVVCGKGNNGGDGFVVARLLREATREVAVVSLVGGEELSPDARANLERLPGAPPLALSDGAASEAIAHARLIVDALLGTGFSGVARGAVAEAIAAIEAAPGLVLSVDMPSGVDASTGVVAGPAIKAAKTITFHVAKPGLWISPGKGYAGDIDVIDIGIPRGAPDTSDIGLIGDGVLGALRSRAAASTKFSSGHVVVVGGSRGLMGAPAMASLAALRAGAGYVTACVPASLQQILDVQLLEVMTRGLADEDGALTPEGLPMVKDSLGRAGCLALGPGLGRNPQSERFARELARDAPLALVLDADGLNAHAGALAGLAVRDAPTVLTPHAGELARLLGIDSAQVQGERLEYARKVAEQAAAIVVLKGDDTLVVDPVGRVAISRGDSPALATAGTGDVLTGTIAALLAQGVEPFAAAAAGVQLHARAGREAARGQGAPEGVIAGDVIAALPAARRR
ncbi:MAG TPA: NAD(P)H-hydrate dehydratase [Solirubrobacteraceae bacterium]|jgi:NAD(P)H-hydrate epimerase|nr:NAD(P)H-hydrate dehydratase [Solirubrobacteraceae bacterium]